MPRRLRPSRCLRDAVSPFEMARRPSRMVSCLQAGSGSVALLTLSVLSRRSLHARRSALSGSSRDSCNLHANGGRRRRARCGLTAARTRPPSHPHDDSHFHRERFCRFSRFQNTDGQALPRLSWDRAQLEARIACFSMPRYQRQKIAITLSASYPQPLGSRCRQLRVAIRVRV